MKMSWFSRILLVVSMLLINACCTKEYQVCEGLDTIKSISFVNFTANELDSVYLISYELNTNFQAKIDSIQLDSIVPITSNNYKAILHNDLNHHADYMLFIKSSSSTYTISDFSIMQESCQQCGEKSYNYSYLISVAVNSVLQTNLGNPPQIVIEQ